MTPEQRTAVAQLQDILDKLSVLGQKASDIIEENFPQHSGKAQAYAVCDFGTSSNPYDTTLDSIINDIWEEEKQGEQ